MFRSLLTFLLLLLTACTTIPPSYRAPAEVTHDEFWSGSILIDGDVVISETSTVKIAPGTRILFLSPSPGRDLLTEHPNFVGSELIVRGRLIALGEAQAPIIFSSIDPAAPAGSWGGVNLSASPESVFRFCQFSQADSAIHSQESTVKVHCSTFTNNLVGVRFFSSPIEITDNVFKQNGTAIRFHLGAPLIRGNLLLQNDKGFFVTSYPEDYQIEGNAILESRTAQVVLGEEVPDDVRMAGNYWGSLDPQEIRTHFIDKQKIEYLGHVDFEPFLRTPPPAERSCNP